MFSGLENEVDQIVYLLYGLTCEEIAIVEGTENVRIADYADCADFLIRVIPESAIICDSDSKKIAIVEKSTHCPKILRILKSSKS